MNKKTETKCMGDMLVVGFHAANPPVIWRFDLDRNHSFTIAMQGDDGDWELGVTSPRGDFISVVHFAAREEAEEAFLAIEKALKNKRRRGGTILRVLGFVLLMALLLAAGVFGFGFYLEHEGKTAANLANAIPAAGAGTPVAPSTVPSGVPVPADDILKPPPQ